jgi:hypothetical protein
MKLVGMREPIRVKIGGLEVTTPRERDEFARIRIVDEIERDRAIVARYEEHMLFYSTRIENQLYELGRLDQRLGGERL